MILWWFMSKDDDYTKGSGEELKKDFKNVYKHSSRALKSFLRGFSRKSICSGRGGLPFFHQKNPLLCLLYPKLVVGGIILLTLLLCGVSFYGLIILILLVIIFILI